MTLFDTHVHTKQTSTCGQLFGEEMAEIYKKAGYDGIVVTDHFTYGYWKDAKSQGLSWESFAKKHTAGYLAAKERGDEIGLKVLYGCELRFHDNSENDYLVYGMTNEYLVNNPDILEWGLPRFANEAKNNGFIFFQAHPFRNNIVIRDPKYLYGVEVLNGNPADVHFERNAFANMWADKFGLKKIAGSDAHAAFQAARGGVCFYNGVETIQDFVREIDEQNYMLVSNPSQKSQSGEIF